MTRFVSIFLILLLVLIHGQISPDMFGGLNANAQITEDASLEVQNSNDIKGANNFGTCCTDNNNSFPVKVSYCQLDLGLSQLNVELYFPTSTQKNPPGPCLTLISKEPSFPLRPPIA